MNPKRGPILCYVTDRKILSSAAAEQVQTLLQKMKAASAAGVDWIQIREKDLSGKDFARLTRDALQRLGQSARGKSSRARILVNNRLDVAISQQAGGIHLSEDGLPVQEVKRMVESSAIPRDFLVGKSCHSLESAKSAEKSGADYIFFGPIFATPSKAGYGAPQGLERLAEVCRQVTIPVVAIGGITLANAGPCFASRASGVAAIRLFQDSPDLLSVVAELRKLAS